MKLTFAPLAILIASVWSVALAGEPGSSQRKDTTSAVVDGVTQSEVVRAYFDQGLFAYIKAHRQINWLSDSVMVQKPIILLVDSAIIALGELPRIDSVQFVSSQAWDAVGKLKTLHFRNVKDEFNAQWQGIRDYIIPAEFDRILRGHLMRNYSSKSRINSMRWSLADKFFDGRLAPYNWDECTIGAFKWLGTDSLSFEISVGHCPSQGFICTGIRTNGGWNFRQR